MISSDGQETAIIVWSWVLAQMIECESSAMVKYHEILRTASFNWSYTGKCTWVAQQKNLSKFYAHPPSIGLGQVSSRFDTG